MSKGVIHDGIKGGNITFSEDLDPVALLRPRAIDDAPRRGTHDTVALYKDGSYLGWFARGCMACISDIASKGVHDFEFYGQTFSPKKRDNPPVAVYSGLWVKNPEDRKDAIALWKFMFNKDKSPWRTVLKDFEWVKAGPKIVGYKLGDMNCSMQVFANLMFSARMVYAQDGFLRAFTMFKKAGFSEVDALYIAANVAVGSNGNVRFPYIGDYPFDTCYTDINYKNWSEGTPFVTNPAFTPATRSEYTPCNAIWHGKGILGSNYTKCGRQPTELQKLLSGAMEYKGSFSKSAAGVTNTTLLVKPVTFDKAVTILKDNEKTWKVGA